MRPYNGQAYSAKKITEYPEGSYIWEPDWKNRYGSVEFLGKGTRAAYEAIRERVPFYDRDRNLSTDIRKAYEVLRSGELLTRVKAAMGNS